MHLTHYYKHPLMSNTDNGQPLPALPPTLDDQHATPGPIADLYARWIDTEVQITDPKHPHHKLTGIVRGCDPCPMLHVGAGHPSGGPYLVIAPNGRMADRVYALPDQVSTVSET